MCKKLREDIIVFINCGSMQWLKYLQKIRNFFNSSQRKQSQKGTMAKKLTVLSAAEQ